uniref:Uncharacterized protein n=1 Tax=Aegilops tauschii subsp. strangulata TaxID=200361 RepID=A0A453PI38_AEGTS
MKDGPEVSFILLFSFEGHWTSQHELFYQNKVVHLSKIVTQKHLLIQIKWDEHCRLLIWQG